MDQWRPTDCGPGGNWTIRGSVRQSQRCKMSWVLNTIEHEPSKPKADTPTQLTTLSGHLTHLTTRTGRLTQLTTRSGHPAAPGPASS